MSPADSVALGAVALVGLVVGELLRRRLRGRGHRTEEERSLPPSATAWVPVAVAVGTVAMVVEHAGAPVTALLLGCAVPWMIGLGAIDLDVRRLPDTWTLSAVPVTVALLGLQAGLVDDWGRWLLAIGVGVAHAACYLVLHLLNPGGLGFGDVKLALPLGVLTGWFGPAATVLAFALAFLVGLVVGLVVAVRSGRGRRSTFPFGPAMLAGAGAILLVAGGSG